MTSARIATFLRANTWAPNLLFIALGCYFLAGAANSVVARSIRVVPTVEDTAAMSPPAAGNGAQRVPLNSIAERNLMALKREVITVDASLQAAAQVSVVTGRNFKESELQPCSMPAMLRATLVADNMPEWSMAVIIPNTTHEPAVFTINEGSNAIADDAFLVDVRSREIVVRRRDHFERCLGEGEANAAPPAPPPPAMAAAPVGDDAPSTLTPGDMTGVTKLSDTEYNVDRTEVDRVLANLNDVATQARIVPSFKNGKSNGFKMFSIKPGSIFSKIGLQNGDVIQKINGYDMNSPDRALELFGKLREATSLAIELNRRGQGTNMNYNIKN